MFLKKAIQKKDARPFKVADNITMMVIDRLTGERAGIQAFFGTGGSRPTLNQPVKLERNKWLHIAVTYDGTAIKSYLTGSLIAVKKEKFDFKGINDASVRIGCAKDRP